jgi:hypothetical protein
MTSEPNASARRVFWIVGNGSSHRGAASTPGELMGETSKPHRLGVIAGEPHGDNLSIGRCPAPSEGLDWPLFPLPPSAHRGAATRWKAT